MPECMSRLLSGTADHGRPHRMTFGPGPPRLPHSAVRGLLSAVSSKKARRSQLELSIFPRAQLPHLLQSQCRGIECPDSSSTWTGVPLTPSTAASSSSRRWLPAPSLVCRTRSTTWSPSCCTSERLSLGRSWLPRMLLTRSKMSPSFRISRSMVASRLAGPTSYAPGEGPPAREGPKT